MDRRRQHEILDRHLGKIAEERGQTCVASHRGTCPHLSLAETCEASAQRATELFEDHNDSAAVPVAHIAVHMARVNRFMSMQAPNANDLAQQDAAVAELLEEIAYVDENVSLSPEMAETWQQLRGRLTREPLSGHREIQAFTEHEHTGEPEHEEERPKTRAEQLELEV